MTSWSPAFAGADAIPYRAAAGDCFRDLFQRTAPDVLAQSVLRSPGAHAGWAGLAVTWHYLHQDPAVLAAAGLTEDEVSARLDALALALRRSVRDMAVSPWIYSGLAGVGWAAAHLGDSAPEPLIELLPALDVLLVGALRRMTLQAPLDPLHGVGGIAMYLLERPSSGSADEGLTRIADLLAATARRGDGTVAWLTTPDQLPLSEREIAPDGYYNAGTAHGVPALAVILARMHARGIAPALTGSLADGAVAWLAQYRDGTRDLLQFPALVLPNGTTHAARLSWCYGDLGISCALVAAGRATGRTEWERLGTEVGLRAAQIQIEPRTAMRDPMLCHGTSGIAHMFARLHCITANATFAAAKRRWFERTLAVRQSDTQFAGGFGAWKPTQGWVERLGLLDGISGAALALQAATGLVAPDWDRLLLMSC